MRDTIIILGGIDFLGYAASGLTLATFAQRTMLPMRILAIGANICFIGYGILGLIMPVLTLHMVLLPINLLRLRTLLIQPETHRRVPDDAIEKPRMAGFSTGLL